MREILFVSYLVLFALFVFIDMLLAISLLPSLLISYWLLKDDIDIGRLVKEVNRLGEELEKLKKK